jgi:hypothetical protein
MLSHDAARAVHQCTLPGGVTLQVEGTDDLAGVCGWCVMCV